MRCGEQAGSAPCSWGVFLSKFNSSSNPRVYLLRYRTGLLGEVGNSRLKLTVVVHRNLVEGLKRFVSPRRVNSLSPLDLWDES